MKRVFWTIIAIAALVLSSCSNKVDLYADDGENTIVYAMLDSGLDTNYFKITKSFIGNANDMAPNYDNSNYKKEDLEVTFSGVFKGSNTSETVTLDTISKWVPANENTPFYSGRMQTYYYTTKKLEEGETYKLKIVRKSDGVVITAKTKTVNSFSYRKPLDDHKPMNFNIKKAAIEWKVSDISTNFMTTAAYFEIYGYFHYNEQMPGSTEKVSRSIKWLLGADKAEDLFTTSNNSSYYTIKYSPSGVFDLLRNDEYLKDNSPEGVQREFEDFEFKITAIGEELYNYYIITNSTSAIQDVPNYSNIDNGYGIMSTRVSKSIYHPLNELTTNKIATEFPNYGFPEPLY